jgi:DNA-directed RNA polymerase specialized sigma subunit
MSRRFRQRALERGVIVADALESTGFQAFVRVDPKILENIDAQRLQDTLPSPVFIEFDPLEYLKFLPELEAEIFFMLWKCGKTQGDVAELVGLSQPTVSYRYRRATAKIAYLVTLTALDVRAMVDALEFLRQDEKDILHDLFFYANQQAVGDIYGVAQSSVKWIALKTRATLERLERENPERYFDQLGLIYYLFKNLGIRIRSE